MSATDNSVAVVIRVQTEAARDALNNFSANLKARMADIAKSVTPVSAALRSVGAQLAAGLSVAGLIAVTKNAIDAADELRDLAASAGVSVEAMGALGYAGGQAGTDLKGMSDGMRQLNRQLADAAAGSAQARAPFDALGMSVTDATGATKSADLAMRELADRFASMRNGPEKTALALRLFGDQGARLIPLLNEGGAALDAYAETYRRLGGVTTDTANRADAFNDKLGEGRLVVGAFGRTLAAELLPALNGLVGYFSSGSTEGDRFKGVAQAVATAVKALATAAGFAVMSLAAAGDQLGALFARGQALLSGDFEGFKAIGRAADEELAAARKKFSEFYAAVWSDASTTPPAPKLPAAPRMAPPGGPAAGKGPSDAAQLAAGRAALLKAQGDAELSVQQEYLKQAGDLYEQAHARGLLSLEEYSAARLEVERRGVELVLAERRRELAEAEKAAGTPGLKDAEKLRFQALAAKLQGDINTLTAREAGLVQANTEARRVAAETLARDLAQIEAGAAKGRADDAIAADRAVLDQRRALGELSAEAELQAERELEARAYAATLAALADRRAAIVGSDAEQQRQRAQLAAETEAAARAHQQRLTGIEFAAEAERKAARVQGQQQAQGAMQTMFSSLLSGTSRAGDAVRQFAISIAQTFEELASKKLTERIFDATGIGRALDRMLDAVGDFVARMVAQWVGGEAATTAATTAGEAAKTGAVAAGASTRTAVETSASATSKSLTIGDAIASIGARAWQAAANVYASISAIPIVGPVLAPVAAVAAGATVLGFVGRIASSEGGEYRVDQERLNIVHRDETILPAGYASGLRRMVGNGAGNSPLEVALQRLALAVSGDDRAMNAQVSESETRERSRPMFEGFAQLKSGAAMPTSPGVSLAPVQAAPRMTWALPAMTSPHSAWQPPAAGAAPAGAPMGRGGDTYNLHIDRVVDGQDAARWLKANVRHVASALKGHARDFGAGPA